MFTLFLIALALIVGGLYLYTLTCPDTFRIERSTTINAPAAAIFAHINSLRAWEAWSPWEKIDPALKRTYDGPNSGVGAVYGWSGDKNIGSGRMEITAEAPPRSLTIALHFMTPFEARNTVQFTLDQQPNNVTKVTQAMSGPNPFISKLMSLVFNMEKMVGPKYEEGLASLKAISEKDQA